MSVRKMRIARSGLTLIELVVVLTVLIALAGLLVPMLPSMLTRAHTSTCSTNMGESAKAVLTYQQLYAAYPNNWDSLTDSTGAVITYFAGGAAMPPGTASGSSSVNGGNGEITAITLLTNELAALQGVGITQVNVMSPYTTGTVNGTSPPSTFDPTFNYYTSAVPSPTPIASLTTIAGLDPVTGGPTSAAYQRCVALNLDVNSRYAVFGIGPRCSMIGTTIQTAPVHFGDQPVLNPEYGYQHLVAIFKISTNFTAATQGSGGSGGTPASSSTSFTQAQFVGCAPVHDTGLGNIQDELQNWYQLTNGGS